MQSRVSVRTQQSAACSCWTGGGAAHFAVCSCGGGARIMASFASEGNGLFVDEDWQGALRAYTKAIDADPANADLYGRRAATLLKLGRAADALVDAEKGLELAPDNALLNLRAG